MVNDTDLDGQPDGWEMQVFSVQENTRSHSLWISTSNWLPPGCDSMVECGKGPGGWIWINYVSGFDTSGDRNDDGILDPHFFLHEMNLSGFTVPDEGRWALDPSFGSPSDSKFDIDNDTLQNSLEAPDRWDTNPVDADSDGDKLPDGWEVSFSEEAIELGLVDNNSLDALGSRGPMDPRMFDSDLDGIDDGSEDDTIKIAKKNGVDHIVKHNKNKGLASAFKSGFQESINLGADIIVNTDQQSLKEIFAGLKNIASISLALTDGTIEVEGGKMEFLKTLSLFKD